MTLRILLFPILLMVICRGELSYYDTKVDAQSFDYKQRVGEKIQLEIPGNFRNVWSIDIPPASNAQGTIHRSICQVTQPAIDLTIKSTYEFAEWVDYKQVITKFEDLKRTHAVLDFIVKDSRLYICFSTGHVKVLDTKTQDKQGFILLGQIQLDGFNDQNLIADGYFVATADSVIFFNQNIAFEVSETYAKILPGYVSNTNFQTASYLPKLGLIAVAEGADGIVLYRHNHTQGTLIKVTVLNELAFGKKVDISDIAYRADETYLLCRISGVMVVQFSLQDQSKYKITQHNFKKTDCDNIVIQSDIMYIACPQIHEYNLKTDKQKLYPDQLFKVRNLQVYDRLVVATGENLIKIYVEGNQVGFYQQFNIDHIRLFHNFMYIATEYSVSIVTWTFQSAQISCGLRSIGNQDVQGPMTTRINVIAECKKQYIEAITNQPFDQKALSEDFCIYHYPLKIGFWQGKQINFLPFKIMGIALLVMLVGIGVGWFLIRRQFSIISAALRKYSSLKMSEGESKVPYNNMIQEKEEPEGKDKPSEVQFNSKASGHEIGE